MIKLLISAYYHDVLIDRYIINMSISQYYKYYVCCDNTNGTKIEALIL